ncbi:MAG: cytochrome c biogenesis protein CcsA [Candidatus Aminicenantes bacterium]|nr:cytochrome c biogenesis protein CcsA [Candidatus Aminicenantes bacterium]
MPKIEILLFWIMIFVYVGAFALHLFSFVSRKEKSTKFAFYLLWIGLALHTAVGIVRWITAAHPPVTDTYELNLTGTWFAMLIFLIFAQLKKVEKTIGLVIIPIVFLVAGYGYMSGVEIQPMGPAFQSPWLIVHVIFAWLAFGCYAIATGAAIFLLLKMKRPAGEKLKKLPEPEALDLAAYRFIVLGFINHAIMIASGAIWAKKLWGHYWNWDPLETWSLISFLFYAFYLHARSFLGWKMKKAAYLILLGLLILAISYWGVEWFGPTMHPGP